MVEQWTLNPLVLGSNPNIPRLNIMIKFAPKQYKQNYLPIKKEKQIFVYKYLLTLSGALQLQSIDSNT